METTMSGKKLVDFVKEYIDDSELLSELENIQLDDIRLNVERRELELLCSAAAAPGKLILRAVETSLIKAFTLNAAVINCSVKEEKREDAPKEPMSELGACQTARFSAQGVPRRERIFKRCKVLHARRYGVCPAQERRRMS